jgi:hypothetical protein
MAERESALLTSRQPKPVNSGNEISSICQTAAVDGYVLAAADVGLGEGVAKHRTDFGWRNESKDALSKIKNRLELILQGLVSIREVAFLG